MRKLLTVVSLFLLITACTQSPPPADSSDITSRSEAWEAALNAADIDALVALYTDDARLLPPNGEMTIGRDAVRAEFITMIDAGFSSELTSVEAVVSGDIAYNVGTYTTTLGGEQVDVGKFIETWHRGDDGQWRIANDIYNSDLPLATASAPETHIMITHDVDDAEHWMAAWRGKNSRHKLFTDNGAAYVRTFRSADDPNLTGLLVGVNDMDRLNAMIDSEKGAAAAAADGVRWDTMLILNETE